LETAEKGVFDISQSKKTKGFAHLSEVLIETVDKIEDVFNRGETVTGISTGLTDFDNKTAGLHNSDLILIAARPSMGKTTLGLNIALHAAVRDRITTAIFSLEMSAIQLAQRFISMYGMIEATKLKTGNLIGGGGSEWPKIVEALGPLSEAPIYIDDTFGISVPELRAKCRRLKTQKNLGLIVIDYLQLMSGSSKRSESRQQEISEISRSLKGIARELNVPILAMSQLSRAPESRTGANKRPVLSDLRESGAIEQDADVVCFIYRDDYYNQETEKKGVAEIIIGKQRNGETGTVEVKFLNKYVKFADLEYSRQEQKSITG
jgi:replicative DNA helicase